MKSRLLILAIVAFFTGSGCAPRYSVTVAGPKGGSPETDLAIQELLVRNLIAEEPARDVVLVSFGESMLDDVDPPHAFFDRLADANVSLQPVSRYDAKANPNGVLLMVRPVTMAGETEAMVAVTRVRYGAGASDGFTARVEWRDGSWRIAKTSRHWNT